MSLTRYVKSVWGSGTWHIARHEPTRYGVWTLCGRSWSEHDYMRYAGSTPTSVCKTCRKLEEGRRS